MKQNTKTDNKIILSIIAAKKELARMKENESVLDAAELGKLIEEIAIIKIDCNYRKKPKEDKEEHEEKILQYAERKEKEITETIEKIWRKRIGENEWKTKTNNLTRPVAELSFDGENYAEIEINDFDKSIIGQIKKYRNYYEYEITHRVRGKSIEETKEELIAKLKEQGAI
jgi:hypothetical protein